MHYPLGTPFYMLNGREPFSIKDAYEGAQLFGGIGSGKTSGSGASRTRSYLITGFGGLVLCAKKDDPAIWHEYIKEADQKKHLMILYASVKWQFPLLPYELSPPSEEADYTENPVGYSSKPTVDFWSSSKY